MFNGNTLIACSKEIRVPAISQTSLKDDCVIEVDGLGKIVWEWQTNWGYQPRRGQQFPPGAR